ncbi:hypothetical protein [Pseudooceanicola sp. LIPI14-2-Ac024]|uniref:hypothetical protein n=1 Tax=Pseudooceanicola sp. LIPI14-2-Ac024 TaxID=3344875 RepID=UPI0035CFCB40
MTTITQQLAANTAPHGEGDDWLPPEAPLAMPRQTVQRIPAGEGLIAHILRVLFMPQRG